MEQAWKLAEADALDAQADALETTLEHIEVAQAVLEQRGIETLAREGRGYAAGLRSEVNAMRSAARGLRTRGTDSAMPIALTTRHRRPAPVPEYMELARCDATEAGARCAHEAGHAGAHLWEDVAAGGAS